jgi:dTDP-4-amino-4,6-dideoxygalactose transaminase
MALDTKHIVPFSPPNITEEEIAEVVDTLRSDWITTGPKTTAFEQEVRAYVGAPAALALNSCTAGLHLALVAHGVGRGDRVATVSMTFAASVNVIEHVGATPLLCDVEPDTLNLCPEDLERRLTDDVKAIIAVHYAGHPVNLDAISQIARARGIPVIEDAAHALAASYRGAPIGSHGNLTAYSFYATKNLTTAEGGMLTGDPELIDRARVMGLHGMSKGAAQRYGPDGKWRYDILAPGFKYNMTDIAAAIGRVQLTRLPAFQARRRQIVARYDAAFAECPELTVLPERPDVVSAQHLYVLRLDLDRLSIGRDEFMAELRARGVLPSVHFIPVHIHPYYRDKYGFAPHDLPVTYDAYERMVSIPLYSRMRDEDVQHVIDAVKDALLRNRK